MKNLFLVVGLLILPLAAHAQSGFGSSPSTLGSKCKKSSYSCGECETDLQDDLNKLLKKVTNGGFTQKDHWGDSKETSKNSNNIAMAPNVSQDETLQEIVNLFKKHNPDGENKLNFVVIGESESLQGSTIKNGKIYPRIMLKSPNSELMVTFNTDPEAKGYKTIEMMRWNGKKGRYEFQELNFGDGGEAPHVDASGTKCMECHKSPSPRPNWDTYRAWAGVVPSRDDMLEMHAQDGDFKMNKGLQPDAKAYINFLDQVAEDKDSGKKSRLAMLEIPFDENRQLGEYMKAMKKKDLTNREKIDLIKKKIDDTGFYRIKHFPDKDEVQYNEKISFNFDQKTAPWSGPSQFAFDQMLAQNMCKVATDLKNHPDFDKFKYPLALMIKCGRVGSMGTVYPENFKERILDYYAQSKYSGLGDLKASDRPKERVNSYDELSGLVNADTTEGHGHANEYKYNRHEKFLQSFLTNVEKLSDKKSKELAKYYSEEVVAPTQPYFHAIQDEGGVKGVPESSGATLSDVRMLLEPFGVKVAHWSLVHGKNNAYNSFSFSDQFELFEKQELFDNLMKEAGSCSALEEKTKAVLSKVERKIASPEKDTPTSAALCDVNAVDTLDKSKLADLSKVVLDQTKPEMKQLMGKCLNCHDKDGDVEFAGLKKFVKSNDEEEFVKFLNSYSERFSRPMIEVFQIKLGIIARENNEDIEYGDDMPPSDWKDNAQYAAKMKVPTHQVQDLRRKQLGQYLVLTAGSSDKNVLKTMCNQVFDGSSAKESGSNDKSQSKRASAGKQ